MADSTVWLLVVDHVVVQNFLSLADARLEAERVANERRVRWDLPAGSLVWDWSRMMGWEVSIVSNRHTYYCKFDVHVRRYDP